MFGDKPLNKYSSIEAGRLRDRLIERPLSPMSVRRAFTCIKAIFNFGFAEYGLDCANPFARIHMPLGKEKKRSPIPIETIREIQSACFEIDDDLRWLLALISDTGMRLSEAAGLAMRSHTSLFLFLFVDFTWHKRMRSNLLLFSTQSFYKLCFGGLFHTK
jgi:site-specific recombinase XerD